jgi:hypothetical protein
MKDRAAPWYIYRQPMCALRRTCWMRAVSLLLLALFVPVQAAGCCKLGAFLWNPEAGSAASPTPIPAGGMAPDHSCCPKSQGHPPVPESGPSASADAGAPCEPGGTGCCLESTGPSEPGLAASPAQAPKLIAVVRILPPIGRLDSRAGQGRTSVVPPLAESPPLYLIHRSLLI